MFTIGDLIIVGLVVVVLAVYRQMDSKNRSLEKVKRLGDKLMADIDSLTQEKVAQLKDISIEVDVHQQASKAAIGRLAEAEAALNERSAAMEEMQSRIAAYDNALRELITMTQKAEENITRLRDESVYIDKVGRRIRQAAGQLQQLQDRLPQMLSEFDAANHASLTATGEQVVAAVESRLANLEGQLEASDRSAAESIQRMRNEIAEAQRELADKADAYRRAFADIEQDYHGRLEEVARKGVALETQSLKELSAAITGQVEERYRQLRAHIEANQHSVDQESERLRARLEEMQVQVDSWELAMGQRHEQAMDQTRQRNAAQEAQLEAAVLRLSTVFQDAQNGVISELKLTQDRAGERITEFQGAVRHQVEAARAQLGGELEELRKGFAEWQMEVENLRQETDLDLRRKLDETHRSHEQDLVAVGGQLEQVRRDLEYQIADAHKENLRTLEEFQSGMQTRVEGLDGSIYQLEQDMAAKLGGVQERAQNLADQLLMRMNHDVDAKTESMREAINRRVEQVNASVKASHDQIDTAFSELRGRVDEWIGASKDYMARLDDQIRTLNEESRNANQEHQATIRTHIAETQERLNAYESGLTARVRGLEESITRAEGQVQQEFERVGRRAAELAEQTGAELDGRYQTVRQELLEHLGSQFGLVREEINQGRGQLEALAGQAQDRVFELKNQLEARFREVETGALDQKTAMEQVFVRQIADLGSSLGSQFEASQGQVQARIDLQIKELRDLVRETHVSLDQTKELHRELGTAQETLDGRIKEQAAGLAATIEDLRQAAERRQSELAQGVQASLGQLQADLASQLDEHAGHMAKRVQLAGQELTDQARQVQSDMDQWRDGLMRQIDELRTLAQGLHSDTLGNIQNSITTVQKQAQDLYNRINTEISGSLNQHEEKILALTASSEGDLRRLQGLTLETQARINTWQETLGRTEADISRDIQEIREQARAIAQKGNDELLGTLRKRQDEMGLVIEEAMAKLKSDIAHSKGDIEQDVGFLQQQIDQWKGNFQEHLKALQESSKKIEEQALVGLAERIDSLSDEAKALTRKAQDEFATTISQHQAQIQAQLEAYNNDLRRIQVVNKDIQGQMAELEAEVGRSKNLVKDSLGEVQLESRRQAEQVKEAVSKEIEERHKALSTLIKQAGEQLSAELAGDKTSLERELALLHQGVDQARNELVERVKLLNQDGAAMRRETMTGFQERIDALRDEARKLTGNVKTEISQILAEHQVTIEKQVKTSEDEFHRIQDLNATSQLRFQEIQDIFNKAEAMSRKEFEDLKDKTKVVAEAVRQNIQADLQKIREEALSGARQGVEAITLEVSQARKAMQAEAAGLANEFAHYSADLGERFSALSKQGMALQEQTVKTFQADLAKVGGQSNEIARTIQEQANKTLELHRQQIAAGLAASADDIGKVRANFLEIQGQVGATQEDLGKKIAAMEADIQRFSAEMAERIARTTEERQNQVMVDVEKRIKDYEKEIAYRTAKIETVNDDISNLEHNLRLSMDRLTQRLREDLEKIGQQLHGQREQDLATARRDMEAIGLQMVSIEKELDELKQRAYDNVSEKLKVFEDDFFVDLKQRSERMDTAIGDWRRTVQDLLARLQEQAQAERRGIEEQYAAELSARLVALGERIAAQSQGVEGKVEAFLGKLDARMVAAEKTVESTDRAIKEEIQTMEANTLAGVQKEFARMNQDLDNRIRAYEREVESRLQKSDVDFRAKTADLQSVVDASRADIVAWQAEVLQQVKAASGGLQTDLAELREKADGGIRAAQDQAASGLQAVQDKTAASLHAVQEKVSAGLQLMQEQASSGIKAAQDKLAASLQTMQEQANSGIKAAQDKVAAGLQAVQEKAAQAVQGMQGQIEHQQGAAAAWQQQFTKLIKDTESGLAGQLADLRGSSQSTVQAIAADFLRQKEELAAAGAVQGEALRKDIQGLEERLARLQGDLEYRSKEAVELFTRDYSGFQADFQRQNKELHEEQELAMRQFRNFAADAKNEFEGLQRKLLGKLDEEAKSIDLAMRDIDKRLKDFTAQTKLFDRADTLQVELVKRIEELRQDIQNVDGQRKTVLDLDPYLVKVRKLADEVNERMARLATEKKRLDGLDEDYKRLVSISNVVDQKLAQVTASNDTLTGIQLSLRHLEEVQNEVEAKFVRLEKKSEILDATSDGVEKNFQYLQDIEQKLAGVKSAMGDLPQSVQELGERVSGLLTHKKEADQALKSVTNLDKILKDVEGRIAELNKSRDWIARTETRFQEITREADDKVNLLSTLVKKEVAGNDGRASAAASGPAPSVREVVIKLAQQGWRVDEIARTTKLSRGEVELILEMGSRT